MNKKVLKHLIASILSLLGLVLISTIFVFLEYEWSYNIFTWISRIVVLYFVILLLLLG